jgi:hypothetical protein
MKRSDPPDVGRAAINLLRRWQAHELGGGASSNTLFAVFGVASPAGRFADRSTYNNPPYPMWLADIAYNHGVEVPPRPEGLPRDHPHSPGAAAMVEHGLSRGGGRRVAMTAAAQMALFGYYREKIVLLNEIRAAVEDSSRRMLVRRHLGACVALLERLGGSPAPTPPPHDR